MGFNKHKLGDQRREAADKEAANRRSTDALVLEDAERLIAVWNERQATKCARTIGGECLASRGNAANHARPAVAGLALLFPQ
jgi:hypothetical protein